MDEHGYVLTDIRVPFGRAVMIILKWMLASIPAMILLYLIVMFLVLLFGGMLAGCAALFTQ